MQADDATSMDHSGPSSAEHAIYRSLDVDSREIRVICVHPGQSDDTIHASLTYATIAVKVAPPGSIHGQSSLESSTSYEAISYTWGDVNARAPMRLNGHNVLMPASAVEVLNVFRSPTRRRLLWVDAIAINQEDLDERASQVTIMGDIYEAASRTLVWLGHEDENTALGVRVCEEIALKVDAAVPANMRNAQERFEEYAAAVQAVALPRDDDLRKLLALFSRKWYGRAWVLQEAFLSRVCICFFGSISIDWRSLLLTAYSIYVQGPGSRESIPASVKICARLADMLIRRDDRARFSLTFLIEVTTHLQASDPRDRVYALLGLSFWRFGYFLTEMGLRPDYRIPFRQCVGKAVRCGIFEDHRRGEPNGCLELLNADIFDLGKDCVDVGSKRWPSWIRHRAKVKDLDRATAMLSHTYAAGSRVRQDEDLMTTLFRKASQDVLSLRGLAVDKIAKCVYEVDDDNLSGLWATIRPLFDSEEDMTAFCAGDSLEDELITEKDTRLRGIWYSSQDPDPNENVVNQTQRAMKERLSREIRWRTLTMLSNRKVFQTADGLPGIGPVGLREGDRVVILFGGDVPFVIGDREDSTLLIGPCFLRGIMRGEAVADEQDALRRSEVFHLH